MPHTLTTYLPSLSRRAILLGILGLFLAAPAVCRAGGGPENVFLVVNSRSWASRTIANYFVPLREIPASNVFDMDWSSTVEVSDINAFRKQILAPVFAEIEARGLTRQIDYIVYSADLPYAISFATDLTDRPPPIPAGLIGSITSLTYLHELVAAKNPNYMALDANRYGPLVEPGQKELPTHGFRSWYGWGPHGERLEAGDRHYMLSTMLAMTSGRGNSVREAVGYLARSATADGTRPKGTIYYVRNNNVRSTTREPLFADAVAMLQKLGVAAEILEGTVPRNKSDVQGAMIGTHQFDWKASGSTILPGAICEHLTSAGGALAGYYTQQTPLTEFLRYGAAGSSGTVIEPYAEKRKFPAATIQVQYARGCSLAEAFYQSVPGPFQLLIVGDPLCRPWANLPKVSVAGIPAPATVRGTLALKPSAQTPAGSKIDHFELFVDGVRKGQCDPGQTLPLDTAALADGYHEVRVVAIEAGPIESQGRAVLPITVANRGRSIEFSAAPTRARWGRPLVLSARSPGAAGIAFYQNAALLGKTTGESGRLEIDPKILGQGPVQLRAVATGKAGPTDSVAARPVSLTVEPTALMPGLKLPPGAQLLRGFQLKLADGKTVPIQDTTKHNWLETAGVKPNETFELDAWFEVPAGDVYQFQIQHQGSAEIRVDGALLYQADQKLNLHNFVPVSLAAGVHRLTVRGRTAEYVRFEMFFGGPGALPLDGGRFRTRVSS
ncbi:MAG: TIGR03790 family protein [Pirellulales bacterium]